MKKYLPFLEIFAFVVFIACAFSTEKPSSTPIDEVVEVEEVWMTWDEAVEKQKTEPRKIIVDVYTDWCGWCKKMDASTFRDEAVESYLGEKFYAVKLDAEQKEDIIFNGETFKYVKPEGARRGVHTLAYALLDGKMSYPTVVYLDENYARIMVSPGFKQAPDMLKELKFAGEEHYKTQKWEEYK